MSGDRFWDTLFVLWVISVVVPFVFLTFSFIRRAILKRGVVAAIQDVDRAYPFPPRHRSLYRALQVMYENHVIVDERLENVRRKLDELQSDLVAARQELDNVGSVSEETELSAKFQQLSELMSRIVAENKQIVSDLSEPTRASTKVVSFVRRR